MHRSHLRSGLAGSGLAGSGLAAAAGLAAVVAVAATPAAATPCTNLQNMPFAQTTITSATDHTGDFVAPGTDISGLPDFCRVQAVLTPTSDSAIQIEVWLPAKPNWNGRFLGTGGGGFQGAITFTSLAAGIQAGFATTNSDLGTGSSGCDPLFCGSNGAQGNLFAEAVGEPVAPATGLFGHPERIKDFGYRAIHLMTVQGKQIANAFYQQGASRSYFDGCSTGGQNALMEAQRFPDDYDGIVAGAAAFNRTHLHMAGVYQWQNTHVTPGRLIVPGQMTLINQAVLKQCAGQDGGAATDPFLTDPRDCQFDPKQLQCQGGAVPPACLTPEQVTTMRNYYRGEIDPVTGQIINPGSARGNETDNEGALGLMFQEQLNEPAFDGLLYWVYGAGFGQPSSPVNFNTFDFNHDVEVVDRQLAEPLNADSADLRAFRAHGGKLLMYHGWADPLIPSQSSINYFNALVADDPNGDGNDANGAQQASLKPGHNTSLARTQEYARLFMVPGMWHCSGGPGPNVFDPITPLVNWVEGGVAPETIPATKFVNDAPAQGVQMTRPLCVFPKVAKYSGAGSTDDAANFACVTDENDVNETPAPKFGP